MVMCGAVPAIGSWKTRPIQRLRLYSGRWPISRPPIRICPASGLRTPEIMFISVDLPAPLLPMTVTKSPGCKCKFTLTKAIFSSGEPG
ncbi:hypothetical protein D1872_289310 [compost metagenome]